MAISTYLGSQLMGQLNVIALFSPPSFSPLLLSLLVLFCVCPIRPGTYVRL